MYKTLKWWIVCTLSIKPYPNFLRDGDGEGEFDRCQFDNPPPPPINDFWAYINILLFIFKFNLSYILQNIHKQLYIERKLY